MIRFWRTDPYEKSAVYDNYHFTVCTKSGKLLRKGSILVAVKIYSPLC